MASSYFVVIQYFSIKSPVTRLAKLLGYQPLSISYWIRAVPKFFTLAVTATSLALSLAHPIFGSKTAAKIPMITITINISINVNHFKVFFIILKLLNKIINFSVL
jgi:hypothetical protein